MTHVPADPDTPAVDWLDRLHRDWIVMQSQLLLHPRWGGMLRELGARPDPQTVRASPVDEHGRETGG